ncbi:hypothetical protein H0H93_003745 [Arthromyces matolae]|nr:hypothetical protein H0H93_003745 [Arthromyces matolae]
MDCLYAITNILTVCFIALSANVKLTSGTGIFIVALISFALEASALSYSLDASPILNKSYVDQFLLLLPHSYRLSSSTSFILGRSDDENGTSSLISGSLVHSVILIAVVLGIFGFFLFVMLLWNHFCPAPRRSRLREETTQDPVDIELVAATESSSTEPSSSSESHAIKTPAAVTSESSSEEPLIPTKSSHTINTPPAVTESSSPEPSSSSHVIDTPAAAHIRAPK